MTTKVNLIHGKKIAHSSEEFSGGWAFLYELANGTFLIPSTITVKEFLME